jgi:hypothetical protein
MKTYLLRELYTELSTDFVDSLGKPKRSAILGAFRVSGQAKCPSPENLETIEQNCAFLQI